MRKRVDQEKSRQLKLDPDELSKITNLQLKSKLDGYSSASDKERLDLFKFPQSSV